MDTDDLIPVDENGNQDEITQAEPVDELSAHADGLANYIYHQTSLWKVTPKKALLLSLPQAIPAETLKELLAPLGTEQAHPLLLDVAIVAGKKDTYYYDKSIMTRQYAELDALLSDKDILATIASVTREDCRLYPRPTQYAKLRNVPFRFTMDEIKGAAARMKDDPQYADIGVVTASNGQSGFYSTKYITKGYAESLLEWLEVGDKENP